jgi:hypothetical protein
MDKKDGFRRLTLGMDECIRNPMGEKMKLMLVGADGTVVFCQEDASILKSALGYDCLRLPPDEAEVRAGELLARFRELGHRHGVDFASYS